MMASLPESPCFLILCKDILAPSTNERELIKVIPIKEMTKWWLAMLLTGVFLGGALLSRAETPDTFTMTWPV